MIENDYGRMICFVVTFINGHVSKSPEKETDISPKNAEFVNEISTVDPAHKKGNDCKGHEQQHDGKENNKGVNAENQGNISFHRAVTLRI